MLKWIVAGLFNIPQPCFICAAILHDASSIINVQDHKRCISRCGMFRLRQVRRVYF
jgi:hypothetical protein